MVTSMAMTGCQKGSSSTSKSGGNSKEQNLTVEVYNRGNSFDPPNTVTDNPMTRWIQENVKKSLNINVSYVAIDKSTEVDKLNVMMAGGTAPDLCLLYKVNAAANFAKNGGLTDLSATLDKYGPEIKKVQKDSLPLGKMYGKQYFMVSKRVDGADKYDTYVNKTLLDKYGLKVPTTKADFYNDMVTIKKNNPSVVPYAMAAPSNAPKYYSDMVMSYVSYKNDKEMAEYNNDSTRLISPGSEDGYRTLNKWYNEGLISKDFALDTNAKQWKADISNGNVFAFSCQASEGFDNDDGYVETAYKSNGSVFTITNPFENSKGEYFKDLYAPFGCYVMVPKKSESKVQAAVQYINWLCKTDNFNNVSTLASLGGATLNSDGVYVSASKDVIKSKSLSGVSGADLSVMAKSSVEYSSQAQYIERWVNTLSPRYPDFDSKTLVTTFYKVSQPKGSYYPPNLGAPTDEETKYGTNIYNAELSMAARVITCKPSDFDSVWATEYKNIQSAGLQQLLDSRGKLYDETKKK